MGDTTQEHSTYTINAGYQKNFTLLFSIGKVFLLLLLVSIIVYISLCLSGNASLLGVVDAWLGRENTGDDILLFQRRQGMRDVYNLLLAAWFILWLVLRYAVTDENTKKKKDAKFMSFVFFLGVMGQMSWFIAAFFVDIAIVLGYMGVSV